MSVTQKHPTLDVLSSYYAQVHNLEAYIRQCIEEPSREDNSQPDFLLQAPDSIQYRELLSSSLVCLSKETVTTMEPPRFRLSDHYDRMMDVIQMAQKRLFMKSKPNNIITLGYSRTLDSGSANTCGITNYFVNTIITAFLAPEWERLLERIGINTMLHLLTNTSIFIMLPNQCLCQLTGQPLIYITPPKLDGSVSPSELGTYGLGKRKRDLLECSAPRKRLKVTVLENSRRVFSNSLVNATIFSFERRTASDILFVRARVFYARPNREPNSRRLIVGLPYNHILNRLKPSYKMRPADPSTYHDPDPRDVARNVRHLSKYIFPLQYKISNVFTSRSSTKERYKQPDFTDRELEIKLHGTSKTPKRLKDVLLLLDKMIWRHGKCHYKLIRDKLCPSKITMAHETSIDSSIMLEMVSEKQSIQQDLQGGSPEMKHKPRFVDFTCDYSEVFRFAVVVTKLVIPKAFWGCERNFKIIAGYIMELITARRYETLTLHHVLQSFMTSECDWLMPPGEGALKQHRVSVTDARKRREVLEEFIFWYFDSFLFPLLRATFYITDSSASRNRVLYFRQDDWETLCQPLIDQFSEKMFRRIEKSEAEEILRQRQLGFSFVRWLPKETGVRPIVNLRKKGSYATPALSINQALRTTFAILTYEKQNKPDLLGASVFSPNEIYTRFVKLKGELLKDTPSDTLPELYFVKVDVQACFDSIEQTKLLTILHNVISEEDYMIRKHGQVRPVSGKIQRAYIKKACPEDDSMDFVAYARSMSMALKQTIFTDQVVYDFQSRLNTLKLLEEHIRENIVKIGQQYFQQIVGIPQGSVLSTILCSFFFGDLERTHLNIFHDPKSLLLRCIDDYLYVTTSLEKAKHFLDIMNKGHPEYGCIISKGKTMSNFEHESVEAANITEPTQKYFPWCGLLIDMSNLSVRVDYSRYRENDLKYSLTVHKGRHPGRMFRHKMLQLAKARSHMIYMDTDLNGPHTVYVNVYQNFIVSAMKMHCYLMAWGINIAKYTKFLHNTIGYTTRYASSMIYRQSRRKASRQNGRTCDLEKRSVMWLGMHAFYTILSKKPEVYGTSTLLKCLKFDLALYRDKKSRHQLQNVVKDGLSGVAALRF